MASATCEVRVGADGSYVTTANGVDATADTEISIRLASGEGVRNWTLECIGTDDNGSTSAINDDLVVDSASRTATFTTADDYGRAIIFRSTIYRHNGASSAETFGIFVPTLGGLRVGALNQTYEGNATHGWISTVNDLIRNGAYGDYSVIRQDTEATTDATPTIIAFDYTNVSAIPDDCIVACTATVLCRDTDDGSKFMRLELARSMACVAGTGTFNGSTREFDAERVGIAGTAVATIGRDAGTLRPYVEVTGIAARNFDWKAILQYDVLEPLGEVTPPAPFDFFAEEWEACWEADNLSTDEKMTGTATAGSSATRDWESTTGAGMVVGGAFGTHDSIDWDAQAAWSHNGVTPTAVLSDLVDDNNWTCVIVADIIAFSATGTHYNDSKIWLRTNANVYWGIGAANVGGTKKILAGCHASGYCYAESGAVAEGKRVIVWTCEAGVQTLAVDGVEVTGTSLGVNVIGSLTDYLRSDESAGPVNAHTALLAVGKFGSDATKRTNIYDWAVARYAL